MHRRYTYVRSEFVQGIGEQLWVNWFHSAHTCSGLDGQRGNSSQTIAAVSGNGLYVGGNPGAGRGIEARNGQHHWRSLGHEANVSESTAIANSLFGQC